MAVLGRPLRTRTRAHTQRNAQARRRDGLAFFFPVSRPGAAAPTQEKQFQAGFEQARLRGMRGPPGRTATKKQHPRATRVDATGLWFFLRGPGLGAGGAASAGGLSGQAARRGGRAARKRRAGAAAGWLGRKRGARRRAGFTGSRLSCVSGLRGRASPSTCPWFRRSQCLGSAGVSRCFDRADTSCRVCVFCERVDAPTRRRHLVFPLPRTGGAPACRRSPLDSGNLGAKPKP